MSSSSPFTVVVSDMNMEDMEDMDERSNRNPLGGLLVDSRGFCNSIKKKQ